MAADVRVLRVAKAAQEINAESGTGLPWDGAWKCADCGARYAEPIDPAMLDGIRRCSWCVDRESLRYLDPYTEEFGSTEAEARTCPVPREVIPERDATHDGGGTGGDRGCQPGPRDARAGGSMDQPRRPAVIATWNLMVVEMRDLKAGDLFVPSSELVTIGRGFSDAMLKGPAVRVMVRSVSPLSEESAALKVVRVTFEPDRTPCPN